MTFPLFAMVGSLLLFFLMGTPLGVAMLLAGVIGLFFGGHPDPLNFVLLRLWGGSVSFVLTAIPLFIYLAELVVKNRQMELAFRGLAPWVSLLPGRLIHVNILGSALFAAVCGSSSATCAVIAKVTLPELMKRDYPRPLVFGTLIGATTLGILIPPSIPLIIYGGIVGESVRLLFIAGVIPGVIITIMFIIYVVIVSKIRYPISHIEEYSWKDRVAALRFLLPMLILVISMMGGMYLGWVTPTEAAAWGIFVTIILSIFLKTFRFRDIFEALPPSMAICSMVLLIYSGAGVMGTALAYLGGAKSMLNFVIGLHLSPYVVLIIVYVIYLILGCFFDGLSILVITTPILYQLLVTSLGFDGIWLGVVIVILIEIACITPPVGFNLYIAQGMTGAPLAELVRSMMPFLYILLLGLLIFTLWPEIVTFLPSIASK